MPAINQLSSLDVLSDGDQFPVYSQSNGDARKVSASTLVDYIKANDGQLNSVTMKQLRMWLVSNGTPAYIYAVDSNIPADIGNQLNILWNHSGTMYQYDALYAFIQTILGFTAGQMAAAFMQMKGFDA